MPIKDFLTETPKMQRIGKLRKGGEKSSNRPGKDLDHFRFTGEDKIHTDLFNKAYPNKPQSISIVTMGETVDDVFDYFCEVWKNEVLYHRCDGEVTYHQLEGADYINPMTACDYPHTNGDALNDKVGRLNFIIPQLVKDGSFGSVIMETHSFHDIKHILAVLTSVYSVTKSLMGVPFILSRISRKVPIPMTNKDTGERYRGKKNMWMIKLDLHPDYTIHMMKQIQLGIDNPRLRTDLIEASVLVDDVHAENPLELESGEDSFSSEQQGELLLEHDLRESNNKPEEEEGREEGLHELVQASGNNTWDPTRTFANVGEYYQACHEAGIQSSTFKSILESCGGNIDVAWSEIGNHVTTI